MSKQGVAQHGEIHMRLVQPKRQSALYSNQQSSTRTDIASQKSVCASEVVREQQSGRRCSISEHERTRNVDCNARRTKSVQSIKKTSHKNDTTNRKQKPPQVEPKLAKEMGETRRDLKKKERVDKTHTCNEMKARGHKTSRCGHKKSPRKPKNPKKLQTKSKRRMCCCSSSQRKEECTVNPKNGPERLRDTVVL